MLEVFPPIMDNYIRFSLKTFNDASFVSKAILMIAKLLKILELELR